MKKALIIISVSFCFLFMCYAIIYFAEPKPQKLMGLSSFDDPTQFGRALYKRLRKQVKQGSIFMIGGDLATDTILKEAFREFIANGKKDGAPFIAAIGTVESVKNLGIPLVKLPLVEEEDMRTLQALKEFERGHYRVLLTTKSEVSQTWGRTQLFNSFEKELKGRVITLSVVNYQEGHSDQKNIDYSCEDSNNLAQKEFLECARFNFSKRMRKKKKPKGKIKAALERYSAAQYVLFYNAPEVVE